MVETIACINIGYTAYNIWTTRMPGTDGDTSRSVGDISVAELSVSNLSINVFEPKVVPTNIGQCRKR